MKQCICSKPKQKFHAVTQPESANPTAVTAKFLSILLSRMNSIQLLESQKHRQFQLTVSQQHQTIRLFNHGLG